MNIKDISRESGLSQQTILSYINKGLITPEKEKGKYVFSAGDLQRLYQIASMQDLGATQEQIHQRYKKKPTQLDTAMANVERIHRNKRIKQIIAAVAALLFFLVGIWVNYRPLTVTYTVPSALLGTSKIHSKTYTYSVAPDERTDLFSSFFYVSNDSDILYQQVSQNQYLQVTDLVIEVKVSVMEAFKYDLLIDREMELDPRKVVTKFFNSPSWASDYVKLIDYTLAS